jgi:cellobiose-specific phosphotransferase system component IIC
MLAGRGEFLFSMVRLVYPAYLNGYEKPLGVLDAWAEIMPRLLFFCGRHGAFVTATHANPYSTHSAQRNASGRAASTTSSGHVSEPCSLQP